MFYLVNTGLYRTYSAPVVSNLVYRYALFLIRSNLRRILQPKGQKVKKHFLNWYLKRVTVFLVMLLLLLHWKGRTCIAFACHTLLTSHPRQYLDSRAHLAVLPHQPRRVKPALVTGSYTERRILGPKAYLQRIILCNQTMWTI